jgi:phenylalanyl-tRNA synthetase alpha chain
VSSPTPIPTREEIAALEAGALEAVRSASTPDAVDAVLGEHLLGRKARLNEVLRGIAALPKEVRGEIGREANRAKVAVEAAAKARLDALRTEGEASLGDREWVDASAPRPVPPRGSVHPVRQVWREVEDVFLGMGFDLLDGPWVEDDHHNFGALNIPPDHPARDMQDTFWLSDGNLLRTHTSPVQVRAMESTPPPIRAVAIGRVFRHEEVDATHENNFHQVEGFLVDRDVSVAHMVSVLRDVLRQVLGSDLEVRLRPSYFPFVEPGFEMDVTFRGRWMELLGCGLVHPKVLRAGGIDPTQWSGFAFGLGIDRLAMLRYGIEDVRHFQAGDLRFLRQFGAGVGT